VSLLVNAYHPASDGTMGEFLDPPFPGADLAGFENWRQLVWGSAATRALGAGFFPQLDGGDLYVSTDQLPAFLEECQLLRSHLDQIAPEGGDAFGHSYRETLARRLEHIEATARQALEAGAWLVIW
jgi:hypothetical protein